MSQSWVVFRTMISVTGQRLQIPLAGFGEDQQAAKMFCQQCNQEISGFLNCQLAAVTDGEGEAIGMSVQGLLSILGIDTIGHQAVAVEQRGLLATPKSRLILPS